MLKRGTLWTVLAATAAIVAAYSWQRPQPTVAQLDTTTADVMASGPASAGAPAYIVASNLPLVGAAPVGPAREVKPERTIMPEAEFRAAKRRAAIPGFGPVLPVTMPAQAPGTLSPNTPGAILNFDGDFQAEVNCGSWVPADQALAVGDGTNPIVQAVNECLSVWTPGGARLLGPVSLGSFFGMSASANVCDPRALFDWRNHRFIVMAITCSAPYSAKIAVSQTNNPLGGWFIYTLFSNASAGALMDYPRMGQDHTVAAPNTNFAGGIYIAYNLFSAAGFNYVGEEWHILPKGLMYAGLPLSYWYFSGPTVGGVLTDSTHPANVWSPYERPRAEFMVTAQNGCVSACNRLTVWSISNPFAWLAGGDGPRAAGINITTTNTWTLPPNAQQPGSAVTVDTLDNRISGAVTYAHGHLHAAHSTANGTGGTASQIWKIQPFLNASAAACAVSVGLCPEVTGAAIRNETVLNYGGTTAAFFATPQPDLDGNVSTVFNFVSAAANRFVELAFISQRVTQTPGTFNDAGIQLFAGAGPNTSGRWGDYSAVSPVGVFYASGNGGGTGNNAMVFSGMYAAAGNLWRTRVGANIFNNVNQAGPTNVPLSQFGDRAEAKGRKGN